MNDLAVVVVSAAVCAVAIAGLSRWRLGKSYTEIATTIEGGNRALEAAAEWAKWMSCVQTAMLGGIGWLLSGGGSDLGSLSELRLAFAMGAFLFTGAGLFCCAWVLSGTSSIALRLHEKRHDGPDIAFDVHEKTIFADEKSPRLGNMMALQHWLWSCGLVLFALLVLTGLNRAG